MSSVELFQKGGPVMYLLLICSLTVAAIAIDRYLFYKRAGAGRKEILVELSALVRGYSSGELASKVADSDNVLAFIAKAAASAKEAGGNVRLALESAYGEAALKLRERLNYLSMIVTLAPLLGLLGTIFGMIESFSIFNLQAGQPLAITGGIGEALIATATGLCVAIFALIVHTYFASRMDDLLTDMDTAFAALSASFDNQDGGAAHAA